MAIADTVMRVTETLNWSKQQTWMNKAELHRWEPLVCEGVYMYSYKYMCTVLFA